MSESRKNQLDIDGAVVKEDDDYVASYKQIPESDQEPPPLKPSRSRSKNVISEEAEEKLLKNKDEATVTVTMAEAKYEAGDHRNGGVNVEVPNGGDGKHPFSGLTKEELLKYADDPFWVRLRWFMFVLFWSLWACMLVVAIAIIVRAPKCSVPPARTWYEVGPLADLSSNTAAYSMYEKTLPLLSKAKIPGAFINPCEETYQVLDLAALGNSCLGKFKRFVKAAEEKSVKVIVDLTANFVSTSHAWFKQSENGSAEYDYFIWGAKNEQDPATNRSLSPDKPISLSDEYSWVWSEGRRQYSLQSLGKPVLNLHSAAVRKHFGNVIDAYMAAGAAGVRLLKARELVVNPQDLTRKPNGTTEFDELLQGWAKLVTDREATSVFTTSDDLTSDDVIRSLLRPPSLAPVALSADARAALAEIELRLRNGTVWPALQISQAGVPESRTLSMLLPAATVLTPAQIPTDNETSEFAQLVELRSAASLQHGQYALAAVPAADRGSAALLACARWKDKHTGYVVVYNGGASATAANLTDVRSLPAELTLHHVTPAVRQQTNYTNNVSVKAERVLVPGMSAVVLTYVPETSVKQ